MKRVFIGGMGRSGTTITLNALYRHGELVAVPIETKFLVEADGFYDLTRALSDDFSTANGSLAISRFFHLMRQQVPGLVPSPFRDQHALSSDIFAHYTQAVADMDAMLRKRLYFADRAPLLAMARRFVEMTFDDLAIVSDKAGWVEKTPANVWRLDYLRDLWPDSYFVHLVRDPRLIFLSLREKRWLPEELERALPKFADMMAALSQRRHALRAQPRYLELRLDQLETHLPAALAELAAGLDLAPFGDDAIAGVAATMGNYNAEKTRQPSAHRLSADQADHVNTVLAGVIADFGYPAALPDAMQPALAPAGETEGREP